MSSYMKIIILAFLYSWVGEIVQGRIEQVAVSRVELTPDPAILKNLDQLSTTSTPDPNNDSQQLYLNVNNTTSIPTATATTTTEENPTENLITKTTIATSIKDASKSGLADFISFPDILSNLIGVNQLPIKNTKCSVNKASQAKYLKCDGIVTLNQVDISAKIIGEYSSESAPKVAIAIELAISKKDIPVPSIQKLLSNSWVSSINLVSGDFTLSFSSKTFQYDSIEYNKGVKIQANSVVLHQGSSLFKLENTLLPGLGQLSLGLSIALPFQEQSNNLIPSEASAHITIKAQIPIGNAKFSLKDLTLDVLGLDSSAKVTLDAEGVVDLSDQKTQAIFDLKGNWLSTTKSLSMEGNYKSNGKPVLVDWFSLDGSGMKLDLTFQPKLQFISATFYGKSTLLIGNNKKIQPTLNGFIGNDTKTYFFQMDVPVSSMSLSDGLQMISSKDPQNMPSYANDLTHSKTILILTNDPASSGEEYQVVAGVNLFANVLIKKESSLATALQPLMATSNNMDKLDMSLSFRWETSTFKKEFKLECKTITLSDKMQFKNVNLAIDSTQGNVMNVRMIGTFLWGLDETNSPRKIAVDGKWNSKAESISFSGILQNWTKPFGLKWLDIPSADVKLIFTAIAGSSLSLKSLVFNGVSSFSNKDFTIAPKIYGEIGENGNDYVIELSFPFEISQGKLPSIFSTVSEGKINTMMSNVEPLMDASTVIVITNRESYTTSNGHDANSGVNLFSEVRVLKNSPTAITLQPLFPKDDVSILHLTLQIKLGLPIDSKKIFTSLKVDKVELVPDVVYFENLEFNLESTNDVSLRASGNLHWKMSKNANLLFKASAVWNSKAKSFIITGETTHEWLKPYGLTWFHIVKSKLSATFSNGAFQKFEMDASAKVSFSSKPTQLYDFKLLAVNQFQDVFLRGSIEVDASSGSSVINTIVVQPQHRRLSQEEGALTDLTFVNGKIVVAYSTFAHIYQDQVFKEGVTVVGSVKIQSGKLLQRMAGVLQQTKIDSFILYFRAPIRSMDNYQFRLTVPNIPIQKSMHITGFQVELSMGMIYSIGLSGGLAVKFKGQKDIIVFNVAGDINEIGAVSLTGGLDGKWNNLFNLHGLNIEDPWISLGLMAKFPHISKFGIGGNMTLGDVRLSLDGIVDITKPTEVAFRSNVKKMSIRNVVAAFKAIRDLRENDRSISVDALPELLMIEDLTVDFAPSNVVHQVGTHKIQFHRGLSIEGYVELLGVTNTKFLLSTRVRDAPADDVTDEMWLAAQPKDFDLRMAFKIDQLTLYERYMYFAKTIFGYIGEIPGRDILGKSEDILASYIKKISFIFPQVRSFSISEFDVSGFVEGKITPTVEVVVVFFGKDYKYSKQVTFKDLAKSTLVLFEESILELKKFFTTFECLINYNCDSKKKCLHFWGDVKSSTCVADCGNLPEVKFIGCVPCLLNSSCKGNKYGNCCNKGRCGACLKR